MQRYQHNEYQIKKEIAEIILQVGGHIFGGYVRDKLLHDSHAQKFYTLHGIESAALYSDLTTNPELSGRWLCPNDIDCYMIADNIGKMLVDLEAAKMHVRKVFERDPTEYLPNLNIPAGSMRHHKYVVNIFNQHHISDIAVTIRTMLHRNTINLIGEELDTFLRGLHRQRAVGSTNKFANIHIDIFSPVVAADFSKYEAPFSNLDFECNGLIYTESGIHLSRSVCGRAIQMPLDNFQKLAKVIDDIDNRIAKVVSLTVSSTRINKMINKDWNIEGNEFKIVDTRCRGGDGGGAGAGAENDSSSCCLICHENFSEINPAYKMLCCQANYHLGCLVQTCNEGVAAICRTGNCVMCRKPVHIMTEIALLEKICDLKSVYTTFVVNRRELPQYTPQRTEVQRYLVRRQERREGRRRVVLATAHVVPLPAPLAMPLAIPLPIPLPLFIEEHFVNYTSD
jgi:hypothetical protein